MNSIALLKLNNKIQGRNARNPVDTTNMGHSFYAPQSGNIGAGKSCEECGAGSLNIDIQFQTGEGFITIKGGQSYITPGLDL